MIAVNYLWKYTNPAINTCSTDLSAGGDRHSNFAAILGSFRVNLGTSVIKKCVKNDALNLVLEHLFVPRVAAKLE